MLKYEASLILVIYNYIVVLIYKTIENETIHKKECDARYICNVHTYYDYSF